MSAVVVDDPWALTARVSPRHEVRVAAVDDSGRPINSYTSFAPLYGPCPALPWAIWLTDEHRMFQLLAFDLDAGRGDAVRDCARLTGWLRSIHLEHTVAVSGPSGGRHVWLSLAEPAPPQLVAHLAHLAKRLLPSLDVSPLLNPATGCVRPPGAPHRAGGASTVLAGPEPVLRPAVRIEDLERFAAVLTGQVDDLTIPAPAVMPSSAAALPRDVEGYPYLPGPHRALPRGSARALAAVPVDGHADGVAFAVLLGAVRAHWRYADVLAVLDQPGMEHFRTERSPTAGQPRRPRRPHEQRERLGRQWRRAVDQVLTDSPRRAIADDPTFGPRAAQIAAQVTAVQTRADASKARWITRTGPGARRVLDALCLLAAQALTVTVEADQRRLATMTGLGRETVRNRLADLAEGGDITLAVPASGVHGHTWTLTVPTHLPVQSGYPQPSDTTWSQGVPPPPLGAPSSTDPRMLLIDQLNRKLLDQAHDVFTVAGLGHAAGQVYAHLSSDYVTVTELAEVTGRSFEDTGAELGAMRAAGLILRKGAGWRRPVRDRRTPAAKRLDVFGILAARRQLYELERALWAWWLDELEWMKLPRSHPSKRRRRLSMGQLALTTGSPSGRLPRGPDRRVDFQAARAWAA